MKLLIQGFLTTTVIYGMITLLHLIIPARWVKGYVRHNQTGEKLKYRLNGLSVLIVSIIIWFALGYFKIIPFDWLYQVRYFSLATASLAGLIFTLFSVLPFPSTEKNLLADLFFGRLDNPQFKKGLIDAKMWLYLVGAVMLELNTLSFASYHYMKFGTESSTGIFLCAAFISYFVFDYLTFEEVHLYTYDFFAEKVGFKLGWGCLTFYPFFYSIGLFTTAHLPGPDFPLWKIVLFSLIFLSGWTLARGANMQKFFFKTRPDKHFLGIEPVSLSDGKASLLVSGFWGASRHINYLGEVLMATGITLSVGHPSILWPWLYPLYYVLLLGTRQIADDKRCSKKYGGLWDEYEEKVKYRIIPFLY